MTLSATIIRSEQDVCAGGSGEFRETLGDVLELLRSLQGSLSQSLSGAGPRFVEIGDLLMKTHAGATLLHDQADSTVKGIDYRGEDGHLSQVDRVSQMCLAALWDWQTRIQDGVTDVSAIVTKLGDLTQAGAKLKSMATQLKTINSYFKIESARSESAERVFAPYTRQLAELVQRMFSLTESILDASYDAQMKQVSARKSISEGAFKLREFCDEAEASMASAAREVNRIIGMSTSSIENTAEVSKVISDQISGVVVALQFHDITRQQIEHVIDALADAADVVTGLLRECEETDEPNPESVGRLHTMLALQVAQLRESVISIEEALRSIDHNFRGIGASSVELVDVSMAADSRGLRTSRTSDRFVALADSLRVLDRLMKSARDISAQTCETSELASQAAMTLTDHVEKVTDINSDINIQALNAVISSRRLGDDGRALSILAKEATVLSNEFSGLVRDVVGCLGSVSGMARDLCGRFACGSCSADGQEAADSLTMDEDLSAVIDGISELDDTFSSSSLAILETAGDLQDAVRNTGDKLDFMNSYTTDLRSCLNTLQDVLESIQPWAPPHTTIDDLASLHSSRYTMESERAVHQLLCEGGSADASEFDCNRTNTISENDDGLGGNVELF